MSTAGGRWPPIFAGPGCVHQERTASRLVKRNRATRVCKGHATGKRSIFTAKSRHSGYGLIGPEDNAALLGNSAFDSEFRAARTTALVGTGPSAIVGTFHKAPRPIKRPVLRYFVDQLIVGNPSQCRALLDGTQPPVSQNARSVGVLNNRLGRED